jgi:hypothetical protein
MKKILSSTDVLLVGFYKAILESHGIAMMIKNYYLTSGVGDLPPNECVPELWLMDDDRLEEAKALLSLNDEKDSAWQCVCGEKIASQFGQCWKCGKVREKN